MQPRTPQPIVTQDAPAPKAAYSQGIDVGVLAMVSGQLGVDPSTGEIPDDVGNETTLVMNHIRAVLVAVDLSMDDVCKTTIFMTDFEDYDTVKRGLQRAFRDPAGPQHGEGGRTPDGREGGDRGRRRPKVLTMMTAGERDENAPWGGWRRKE
jgi:2-iminobutanoate/2-iminopropanoate deaminase